MAARTPYRSREDCHRHGTGSVAAGNSARRPRRAVVPWPRRRNGRVASVREQVRVWTVAATGRPAWHPREGCPARPVTWHTPPRQHGSAGSDDRSTRQVWSLRPNGRLPARPNRRCSCVHNWPTPSRRLFAAAWPHRHDLRPDTRTQPDLDIGLAHRPTRWLHQRRDRGRPATPSYSTPLSTPPSGDTASGAAWSAPPFNKRHEPRHLASRRLWAAPRWLLPQLRIRLDHRRPDAAFLRPPRHHV